MPREKAPVPDYKLTIYLPRATYEQARDYLYSPLERRVPHGRWKHFINDLITGLFSDTQIDLGLWIKGLPTNLFLLRGKTETISQLTQHLADQEVYIKSLESQLSEVNLEERKK